jgi:AcrR family transcriptional regulator
MASKIRDRIVTNAIQSFSLKGYHGCSTKDIAERANVTEGSLFRLCCSKEQLFNEALSAALHAKKIKKLHLRMIAFAMLEGKGFNEENQKALARLSRGSTLLRELRAISK